ncbi:MAG: TipAS antibiotic-recognition domain-containing protein [Bacilli bacterium]
MGTVASADPAAGGSVRSTGAVLRVGPEKIKEVENEWPSLIAKVRTELDNGTPPENPEVQHLAKRWKELVNMFTDGDSGITRSAERYYAENPEKAAESGIDKELWQYISRAMAVLPD